MKEEVQLKGYIKRYFQWLLIPGILLLIMNICIYPVSLRAGISMSVFLVIYIAVLLVFYFRNRSRVYGDLISFAGEYSEAETRLMEDLSLPYALLDDSGEVLWANKAFLEAGGKSKKNIRRNITVFFPEFTTDMFPDESSGDSRVSYFTSGERDYRAEVHKVYFDSKKENDSVTAVCLFDETEKNQALKTVSDQRMLAGLIYLDNYDEALESLEEVRRSLLVALVDREVNKYISACGGIVRKLEKDKYFVALQEKDLAVMRENKFELLQDVKEVNIGNEMPVTISIGLGYDGKTFAEDYEYARTAIDLALARGGDQVVLKQGENISYFGGKTQQKEKSTRVRARVKAQALREFIEGKERVVVMGHKRPDADSFGATVGIYCAAEALGKRAYVVLNEVTTSVRPMRDFFKDNAAYESDMFLNSEQALEMTDQNTVLVVVDTNRRSMTECPDLLSRTKTIVVLDHHRQSNEQIENAVLSYIEPYASSACEMVAEVLQYFDDNLKLRSEEADCLYAGMVLDTNNFITNTGVRTFEAAAFLRRCGADVVRVHKMFRNDMAEYKARAEAVRHAELYNGFAISVCPTANLESPTIVGAQAANELLNINGVKASVVLTDFQHQTYISARSIDEVNVQVLMERMGGGGHMNMAGAQLDCSVDEAIEIVKHTIDKMFEEGEL